MRKKNWTSSSQPKKNKKLENQEKPRVFFAFFLRFFCVFFCVLFVVFFSSSQGSLFLCEASLATQIFDVISCGPGKLDLSRSMLKKGATQLFPISDPYPAGTKR